MGLTLLSGRPLPPGEPGIIRGHPVERHQNLWDPNGPPITITVCANCGQMRTVLWLDHDRWICTRCKTAGSNRPTIIPIN